MIRGEPVLYTISLFPCPISVPSQNTATCSLERRGSGQHSINTYRKTTVSPSLEILDSRIVYDTTFLNRYQRCKALFYPEGNKVATLFCTNHFS